MKRISFFLALCLFLAWQNADAAPYKLIHHFIGGIEDGRTPLFESSVVASGNMLYGMTENGGKYDNGVVYQVTTAGAGFKLLHTFNGYTVVNTTGSKDDGAHPLGTPVLDANGTTLYGMTEWGGSNSFGLGTIFSVNTDGSGFKVIHHFGGTADGSFPQGSLIISGTTLFGMTSSGGTNIHDDEGIIFKMQTDGSGYQALHDFDVPGQAQPQGALILWGDTLYGMTQNSIFRIDTNGGTFLVVHSFTGTATDGAAAEGSLVRQGGYFYGMTSQGGQNAVGTVFQYCPFPFSFRLLHSFSLDEAYTPYGDLALSGSTLYGITSGGVTNYRNFGKLGTGAVFQIQTNGDGYQIMHTFLFPITGNDGSLPFGSPMILGSQLYGTSSLGGSPKDGGTLFALTIPASSGGGGGGSDPPAISTPSPLPNGKVGTAYHQQLAATGGTAPYTWSVSAGHLPPGLTLSAAGVLGGKPTKGEVAAFTIKVTGHDKETSSQAFSLTVETSPTFVISTPKPNQKITTPTFTVTGTAADAVGGVAHVLYQLNGGPWLPAQTANGFANWTIPNLPLPADADTLSAYAVDTFGNSSKTNTVKFTYYVTGPLIVEVQPVGSGSFAPPDNGKNFQIGATFPISAKPAKGFAFVSWTDGNGTVLTTKPALKFVMSSNLTLIANFAAAGSHEMAPSFALPTTPFQETAGNYAGLFAPTGDARQASNSGAMRLTLTQAGLFSGKLTIGADSLPFTGSFDASGKASVSITGNVACEDCPTPDIISRRVIPASRKKINLTATLQLDFARQSISGELTEGSLVAQIAANRGAFGASNPAQEFQGRYPVTITTDRTSSPAWQASGTTTVDALGNVSFGAELPDGTCATQTSLISREGYFPLYTPFHGAGDSGNRSLWAWLQIANGTIHSLPNASTLVTSANKSPAQITITPRTATNQQ